jgi:2-(1,2-epoxy-1,2-dihydrophenyl)acetyl-CoA isomerase
MTNRVRINPDRGPLGTVTEIELVNAGGGNTIDFDFTDELWDAVGSIDPNTTCIALTAEGKNFCLGGDLSAFSAAADPGEYVSELADRLHRSIRAIRALHVPIVVGVQGWAAGAGMSLAMFGDICVAETSTKFRTAYGAVGLTPDGGLSWALPRAVGRAVALDLFLTQRSMDADEAHRLGAVSRIVDDGRARDLVRGLAGGISSGPRAAIRATTMLVDEGVNASFSNHLDAEAASIGWAAGGAEGREGVDAFLNRRRPNFASVDSAVAERN